MRINRRDVLRGLGTALGLPLFEAMGAAAKAPCRMAFLYRRALASC